MQKITLICLTLMLIVSCKKEEVQSGNTDSTPKEGNLTVTVKNMAGADDVVMSDMKFSNAAGNMYSISTLKYYISNVVVKKKDGTRKNISIYKLIDASNPASCTFNLGKFDAGDYDSMYFNIGVDPARNHTGVQDGDLDVSKGMFWTWSTGYIFFKHEGQYKNSSSINKSLIFHLATDAAFASVALPISLNVNGDKNMHIKFDLNSVYSSPSTIDFNVDNNRQSSSAADDVWISQMKSNFYDAFSYIKTE